jgi:hypothetical protein
MTDDGTGPDDEEQPSEDTEYDSDTSTDESRSESDGTTPDSPTGDRSDSTEDDTERGSARGEASTSNRAHPWAPYDRDDPDQAASFDAPTRDVRPGVDYDVTARHEDPERLREELEALKARLDDFESDVERRTLPRDEVERDLRRYVRRRLWRGHARGWGPYLVLLYGTVMTLGAFVELEGAWAIAAMIVLWLSTLGLYVFMIVVGFGIGVLRLPWKFRDRISDWRSS